MLALIFVLLMLGVFGKLAVLAVKMAWGITKVAFTIIFLPAILIIAACTGFIYLAIIGVVVVGIISLVTAAF